MILTSRRQQRVLAAMQGSLRESDPRLVARFTMFTELTGNAAMPAVERVRLKPLRRLAAAVRGLARRRRWARRRNRLAREARGDRARWRLGGAVLIPALAVAMLAVVMLVGQGKAQGSCTSVRTGARTSAPAQASPGRGGPMVATCPAGQVPTSATGR